MSLDYVDEIGSFLGENFFRYFVRLFVMLLYTELLVSLLQKYRKMYKQTESLLVFGTIYKSTKTQKLNTFINFNVTDIQKVDRQKTKEKARRVRKFVFYYILYRHS